MKIRFLSVVVLGSAIVSPRAATFTVTVLDDSGAGSLRQAILDANATPGDDTIVFTTNGTIALASPLPLLTDNATIAGPGTNQLTISGNNAVQVFAFNAGTTNALSDLTIANGLATGYANGAGIANAGQLTILNCALINNTNLGGWGGAVFSAGTLTISNSTFAGNQVGGESAPTPAAAGGGGGGAGMGGALTSISGTIRITACSFIENLALGGNGADGGSYSGSHRFHSPGGRGGGINGGQGGILVNGQWNGQNGGLGGGGGGGTDPYNPANGGVGGFGAGGGGGGCRITPGTGVGGQAGFGGGSGGSAWFVPGADYGSGGGGGGAGLGAAIFLDSGVATITDTWFVNNQAAGGYEGHGGAAAATGSSGSGCLGTVFTRDGTVLLHNTAGTVVTPSTPLETWGYNGKPYLAPVGTPMVFADGQFVLGAVVNRGSVQVSLQTSFPLGTIVFSMNGSDPRTHSTLYTGPFSAKKSTMLRSVAYNSDFTASVEMDPVQITILPTLTATTTGGGTIAIAPPNGPYFSNSWAQITAQPASGFTFLQWLGDAGGTNSTTAVTMNRDKYVQAIFGTTVGTTIVGGGSIIADPSLPLYPFGTAIRFTAQPQAGNAFAQWGSAASGTNNPVTFIVSNASQSVAAVFSSLAGGKYTLTVLEDGPGHVVRNPQANSYGNGQAVTLTALPDPGQDFVGWTGTATGTQNPLTATMNSNKMITASFTKRPILRVGTPLEGLVEEGFRLAVIGEFYAPYTILGSTNLRDWSLVGAVTNTYGTAQVIDPNAAGLKYRFYRSVSE